MAACASVGQTPAVRNLTGVVGVLVCLFTIFSEVCHCYQHTALRRGSGVRSK